MPHSIYKSDAFVLAVRNIEEDSRYVYLFTESFGLIAAKAQAIRGLKSKLRYSLQPSSFATLSLVRGRGFWRVIDAAEKHQINFLSFGLNENVLIAKAFSLLRRLVVDEGANVPLFRELEAAMLFLKGGRLRASELDSFEVLLALRILKHLGYLKRDISVASFSDDIVWNEDGLSRFSSVRREAVGLINSALIQSHL